MDESKIVAVRQAVAAWNNIACGDFSTGYLTGRGIPAKLDLPQEPTKFNLETRRRVASFLRQLATQLEADA